MSCERKSTSLFYNQEFKNKLDCFITNEDKVNSQKINVSELRPVDPIKQFLSSPKSSVQQHPQAQPQQDLTLSNRLPPQNYCQSNNLGTLEIPPIETLIRLKEQNEQVLALQKSLIESENNPNNNHVKYNQLLTSAIQAPDAEMHFKRENGEDVLVVSSANSSQRIPRQRCIMAIRDVQYECDPTKDLLEDIKQEELNISTRLQKEYQQKKYFDVMTASQNAQTLEKEISSHQSQINRLLKEQEERILLLKKLKGVE